RLSVLYAAIDTVCRGGTISLSGVDGGAVDPLPMLELCDKQIQLRMGQANVKTWIDDVLPLVSRDDDPLGVESLATHHLPLEQAPQAYQDRKSTRLNSSHVKISYAVFCLKKKKTPDYTQQN